MLRFTTSVACALAAMAPSAAAASSLPDKERIFHQRQQVEDQEEDQILTIAIDELNSVQRKAMKDNGIKLATNDSIRLAVRGNPTTGYTWQHD